MKNGWMIALALALLVGPTVAFADVSAQGGQIQGAGGDEIKTIVVAVNTDSAGTLAPGNRILGFKMITAAANGYCALFDAATVPSGNTGLIDDLSEATAAESNVQMWPRPYKLVTDLSVRTNAGSLCIIYYQ